MENSHCLFVVNVTKTLKRSRNQKYPASASLRPVSPRNRAAHEASRLTSMSCTNAYNEHYLEQIME